MAIASIGNRGTGVAGGTASTVVTMVPSATVAVGRILLVSVVSPSTGTHDSVTDTSGNTYEKLAESSGNSQRTSLWRTKVKTQLTTASTITATFGSSITDKCIGAREFSVATGYTLDNATTPATNTDNASGFGSLSFSSLSSAQRLYWRACGKNANSTTALTVTTGFTSAGWTIRSRSSTAARILRAEFRINTSTGETSNPTFAVAGPYATLFAALAEVLAPVEGSGSPTLGAATGAGTGTVTAPSVTGEGASTLGAATSAGNAAHGVAASGSASLSAATATATGAHGVAASGAPALSDATGEGEGTASGATVTGSGAATLGAAAGAGAGSSVAAQGAASLAAATSAGTGTHSTLGAGAPSLGAATGTGVGTQTVIASGSTTLAAAVGAGSGTATAPAVTGGGAVSLSGATSSGAGLHVDGVLGAGAVTLGAATRGRGRGVAADGHGGSGGGLRPVLSSVSVG